jgi:hypothetical protein
MLTGRIIVAIAGAAALIVAGVFIVRGVISSPPPKLTGSKASSVAAPTAPPASSADPNANPSDPNAGGPSDPNAGSPSDPNSGGSSSSSSSSSSPSSGGPSTPASPPPPPPLTPNNKKTTQKIGQVDVNVDLPQVQGGKDPVAQNFNSAMEAALQTQAGTLSKGTLTSDGKTGLRIGKSVLSGLLHSSFNEPATTPIMLANTVVVDTTSGSTFDTSSIFTDTTTGLKKLQTEAVNLGPTKSTAPQKFVPANVKADAKTFAHWTAETDGMRVYFAQGTVASSTDGVVELLIPWANLKDVLKPGVQDILSS